MRQRQAQQVLAVDVLAFGEAATEAGRWALGVSKQRGRLSWLDHGFGQLLCWLRLHVYQVALLHPALKMGVP